MRASKLYSPLVDYLNARIEGARLVLMVPKTHNDLDEGLRSGQYMFSLGSPLHTVRATEQGYHVIAKKADDQQFYGVFLVRRDSGIKRVSDLKGKKVSYPNLSGVAANILPKQFLKAHGIDVNRDIVNHYVGSHESSIQHVYMGEAAAGVVREFAWKEFQKTHAKEAAELEVKWRTDSFIDQGVVAHRDAPAELSARIVKLLLGLHETDEGRILLSNMDATKFEAANNATYDKARKFFSDNSELLIEGMNLRPLSRGTP